MNDLLKALGKRIRELRLKQGLSQERFAEVAGFHRTYAGQIERGETNISFSTIERVARTLGIRIGELFDGLEEGQSAKLPKSRKGTGTVDRNRLQIEIAALERSVSALREIAEPQRKGGRKK